MDTRVCRLHQKGDIRIETLDVAAPGPGEALLALSAGGICGSDLHYYQHGGFGPIVVKEPIILGHEASGTVLAVGEGVTGLEKGAHVAINPSRPCGDCEYCNAGLPTHCLNMRFSGSAMRFPHEQGLFRDRIVVDAAQCVPVSGDVSLAEAACSEPLAVCTHAHAMSGGTEGKRVLVTGAGPIGALCAAVAKAGGASEVVVTDLQDFTLSKAAEMGATETVNMATQADRFARFTENKGHFDVVFECSAAAPAIASAISALRPQGKLVQVGVGGETKVPLNAIVGKELTFQGTQRFLREDFETAASNISSRRIDVRPMITGSFPLEDADAAFKLAGDRTQAVKVHLSFAG
ncbi:L-idonate 5-dehydrogenase [Salipiger mucosus]|uniref:L-idonate 5-dehydrogenase n=1 Tax=Salipiger mucosus DSM 16094 TaxID=1123237 RepID=S9QM90_9RHOB|nr:L-idonate 5-dehydrogenase [Salipiger mucosus]EPX82571.1 L-idonate 5-dehydrogenase [Salipiger mucosus DSM 16094]